MSNKVAYETLDELLISLDLNKKFPSKKLESILIRNYILSYYTIWETYAKNKIYNTYLDYAYLLHTETFIKRYLQKSFGKPYLTKSFLKDISDTKVKKEILCQSNNLDWSEFADLHTTIGLDISPLYKLINESTKIKKIVDLLKSSNLYPVHKDNISTSLIGSVSGYIQLIVDLRNNVSHTYKMHLDEHLNPKQMKLLIHLLKCTINLIEEHIKTAIFNKYIDDIDQVPIISVEKVHKQCNGTGNQEGIIEVTVIDKEIDISLKQFVIKSETNSGYCNIKGIKYKNLNIKDMPLNRTFTMSITSNIKIRKGYQYELCLVPYKSREILNIIQYS